MPKMSYEGLVGTVIALIVVVLDQAGVKNPYILWGAFVLGFALLLDAAIRSSWNRRRKAIGAVCIILLFALFGGWLLKRPRKSDLVTTTRSENHPEGASTVVHPGPKKHPPTTKTIMTIPPESTVNQTTNAPYSANVVGSNNQVTINDARRLNKEDRNRLIGHLSGLKVKVRFAAILAAPDAYQYASDLREAFKAAGLEVADTPFPIVPQMFGGKPWAGTELTWHGENQGSSVTISLDSPQGIILQALDSAHANPAGAHVSPDEPDDVITVVVGLKPEEKKK